MKRKVLGGILLAMIAVSCIFGIKCNASMKTVKINNTEFSVDTVEADSLAYIVKNNPVFQDSNLNEFVNYTVDVSSITDRTFFNRVLDGLKNTNYEIGYSYTFDKSGLTNYLKSYNETAKASEDAYIIKDDNGFSIVDAVYGNIVDVASLVSSLACDYNQVNIEDYFVLPDVTSDDLQEQLSQLNAVANWTCTYTDGREITASPEYITYEDGEVLINTDWISEAISDVVKSYNTVGVSRIFTKHNGEVITISNGTWGSKVDSDAEVEELINYYVNGVNIEDRTPVYSVVREDIGDTYVEVSISDQHVWVYQDGVVTMESDCVTGKCDNRHETPTGMYYMSEIQNGRTLRPQGSTSGTWVNKWMRITGDGVGLHDAYWRSSFGGNIYKSNGSHGCINLPSSFAYKLFDIAYLGMPVIVY
jgi:hypothetical protein